MSTHPSIPTLRPVRVATPGHPSRLQLRSVLLAGGTRSGIATNVLFSLGAVAVGVSAVVHLHLWVDGYSGIHVIGPLFLVQSVVGLLVAVALLALRRLWTAALGLGYLLASLTGFLLSVHVGLFGFEDTWSAPFAATAFWDEVVGAALLLVGGLLCGKQVLADLRRGRDAARPPRLF